MKVEQNLGLPLCHFYCEYASSKIKAMRTLEEIQIDTLLKMNLIDEMQYADSRQQELVPDHEPQC